MEASVEERAYYCPACGTRADYPQKCAGRPDSPHPPQEVVSTAELRYEYDPHAQPGTQGYHTPAPDTTNLG